MQPTAYHESTGLSIKLDQYNCSYAAGDTTHGIFTYDCTEDEAIGAVDLAFHGRAKTKFVEDGH